MLNNNNQKAVKRISQCSMKQNRIRNMFAVLAIILTTFMFTTVFSIGFSLAKNINIMMLREQGTKSTIFLNNPTKDQISKAENCKHINAAGIKINTGSGQSIKNSETIIALDYYNKTEYNENFLPAVSNIEGNYPSDENEIMLSKAALDALDIMKPEIGMNISLILEGYEKTFTLSGYFTDYSFTAGGFQGFVSKAYTDNLGLTAEKNGTLSMSSKTGSQSKLLEELSQALTLQNGQEIESSYDVQDENGSNLIVTISIIGLIGLIIILSGYLLIYNVMYISVTKDIRFYGMLKTIGTSPKQISKIVQNQAFRLSVFGIPIGIALGTITSFVIVPYALEMFGSGRNGAMPTDISFNPFIYIGTVLFGIITVALSCRKPSRLASRVSPVEALKYNGQNSEKIKPKKSTDGGKLYKMAYRNVFREKKRAILVFASLFMGTMAFLSTNAFIGSMKLENYVNFYLPNDYTVYTNSGSSENSEEQEKSFVEAANKLAEDIKNIDGVEKVMVNRTVDANIKFDEELFMPFIENTAEDKNEIQDMISYYNENPYAAPVIAVDRNMMELYNKKASQKIDIDRFEKGEICFLGYVKTKEQANKVIGKNITLNDPKSNKSISLEVGTCPLYNEDYGINIGYYWQLKGAPACILVSSSAIEKLSDNLSVDNIIADCDPKAESYVTKQIKELTKTNPSVLHLDIKSEMISDFKSSMTSMNVLTAGISIILILIGIINFINVMLTGVFTRKKEFAVIESVGMTKKQIRKMLMLEGIYYGVITIGLILTLGNAIVYAVARLAENTADYAIFNYPWKLMIGIAVVIMAICMIVPSAVYRIISKESVTERLRSGE